IWFVSRHRWEVCIHVFFAYAKTLPPRPRESWRPWWAFRISQNDLEIRCVIRRQNNRLLIGQSFGAPDRDDKPLARMTLETCGVIDGERVRRCVNLVAMNKTYERIKPLLLLQVFSSVVVLKVVNVIELHPIKT